MWKCCILVWGRLSPPEAGYAPGNNELTAHELTHTIQQGATKRLTKQIRQQPESSPSQAVKKITLDNISEKLKRVPFNSFGSSLASMLN